MNIQFAPILSGTVQLKEINLDYVPSVGETVILDGLSCEFYVEPLGNWHCGGISSAPDYKVAKREFFFDSNSVCLYLEPCNPEDAKPQIYIERNLEDKKKQ